MNFPAIIEYVTGTLEKDRRNRLRRGIYFYSNPLVGVAAADDPIFELFPDRTVVGPSFRKPREWLPPARSVVSYFLPFAAEMRALNEPPGAPAREWLLERGRGALINRELRNGLVEEIRRAGHDAVAPVSSPEFALEPFRSNWPERHIG